MTVVVRESPDVAKDISPFWHDLRTDPVCSNHCPRSDEEFLQDGTDFENFSPTDPHRTKSESVGIMVDLCPLRLCMVWQILTGGPKLRGNISDLRY